MPRQLTAVAWLTLVAAPVVSFTQTPQQPPVFRSRIDLVHLDVSVLDKDRRPVRGLTAADFTVLEDGKPQTITAFWAVDVPEPPVPLAAWMRDIAPDVKTNEVARTPDARLIVILIDDALLPHDAASIESAKKIARGVIDRVGPSDQVAVVFSKASGSAQDFTNDRARLLAAVDTLAMGHASYFLGWDTARPAGLPQSLVTSDAPGPVTDNDAGLRQDSMRTLRMVADTLIAAPHRRKVLMFVSAGISVDPASAARPLLAGRGFRMAMKEANRQLLDEMPDLFRRMQRANVTIYPADPCGLGGLESYVRVSAAQLNALRGAVDPVDSDYDWLAPSRPPRPEDLARHFASINLDFLKSAAEETGGLALVNTNDFGTGLDRVFSENGSYYLLGYQPQTRHRPESFHRLDVRVNRPGVRVRTRSGFEVPPADAATTSADPAVVLARTLGEPVAAGDLSLRLSATPIGIAGRADGAVLLVIWIEPSPTSSSGADSIELLAQAFTPDGRGRGATLSQTARLSPRPAGSPPQPYEILSQLDLPPGRYTLRVAARRASDHRIGSIWADVVVPGIARTPLSASEILIEASPGWPGGPKDAFVSLVPLVPTARREFAASDRVTAFFRVWQGGEAPLADASLAISVLNERGARVVEAAGVLPASRFSEATRSLDHRFAIPLASLPPGQYLLSFEVKVGAASLTRHVRFNVV